jgi:hypothetical protein
MPAQIGPYWVEREIGRGGMGAVVFDATTDGIGPQDNAEESQ